MTSSTWSGWLTVVSTISLRGWFVVVKCVNHLATPEICCESQVAADELKILDPPRTRAYIIEEHVTAG
jgi:hypothetical protein